MDPRSHNHTTLGTHIKRVRVMQRRERVKEKHIGKPLQVDRRLDW
jgi:hypothetical protein